MNIKPKTSPELIYHPQRKRNLFSPADNEPYKLSRSKIDTYLKCPRCFYLDRRCGTGQPPTFPFTLNSAVDELLKKEFNYYRLKQQPHPLFEKFGIEAIPYKHKDLARWAKLGNGIKYQHKESNFEILGIIDDIWQKPNGELIIVDYKATSSKEKVSLDDQSRESLKRQMEIYQWIFRKNGFEVSSTGYFVYCNGDSKKDFFLGALNFHIDIIPYTGNDSWIENTLFDIKKCLVSEEIPPINLNCNYCSYWHTVTQHVERISSNR